MRFIIAPSILACDLTRLGEELRAVERAGADWHHLDIMDGHFVPNLTFGPDMVQAVKRAGSLPIDVHLMTTNPADHAQAFIQAGAHSITCHIEVLENPVPLLKKIRNLGARANLVLKPETPVDTVFPYLDLVDMVLVMTVEPGYTGQDFMPDCLHKIAALRRRARQSLDIQVDGGLNEHTVAQTAAAGANVVVTGAAVYRADDIPDALRRIRAAMTANYRQEP